MNPNEKSSIQKLFQLCGDSSLVAGVSHGLVQPSPNPASLSLKSYVLLLSAVGLVWWQIQCSVEAVCVFCAAWQMLDKKRQLIALLTPGLRTILEHLWQDQMRTTVNLQWIRNQKSIHSCCHQSTCGERRGGLRFVQTVEQKWEVGLRRI